MSHVRYVGGYRLELGFTDGYRAEVDFEDRIVGRGGVFRALADIEFFSQVRLVPEAGTVVWPNGVDFCPDVLYSLATGRTVAGDWAGGNLCDHGSEIPCGNDPLGFVPAEGKQPVAG